MPPFLCPHPASRVGVYVYTHPMSDITDHSPRFIVHDANHMEAVFRAAAKTGRTLSAQSGPGAGVSMGAGVFLAMADGARVQYPDADVRLVLDCANDTAAALNALRQGASIISLEADDAVSAKIADIAKQSDAELEKTPPDRPRPQTDLFGAENPYATAMATLNLKPELETGG